MQYTTHYILKLPEGSDIVNPLVQDNPNYSAIDTALYDNKVRTVGNATEVKTGTVHAVTRSDSDIDVIRFTATGDWITGDTMTVDGTPVSVFLPDGSAPLTGAYVINTEVMIAVNGNRVTLYTGSGAIASIDAVDVDYDNTGSGLTATNAQTAIDELNSDIGDVANDVSALDGIVVKKSIIKKIAVNGTTDAGGNYLIAAFDTRTNLILGFVPTSTTGVAPWYTTGSSYNQAFIHMSTPNAPISGDVYYITLADLA